VEIGGVKNEMDQDYIGIITINYEDGEEAEFAEFVDNIESLAEMLSAHGIVSSVGRKS
jgi:hypothetical protein